MSAKADKQHDVEFADLRPGRIFESRHISDPAETSAFMAAVFGRSSRIRTDEEPTEVVQFFEVTDWPYFDEENKAWKVACRYIEGDYVSPRYLSDLGVLPYSNGRWNERTLTIVEMEAPS